MADTDAQTDNPDTKNPTAADFMERLQRIEATGDVGPLVEMFAAGATLAGIVDGRTHHGADGATKFWTEYLSGFQKIHSDFSHVSDGDSVAILEWTSRGTLKTGTPIEYRGCSLLEIDGGKVGRFRTYYDSAAFLPDGAKTKGKDPAAD